MRRGSNLELENLLVSHSGRFDNVLLEFHDKQLRRGLNDR